MKNNVIKLIIFTALLLMYLNIACKYNLSKKNNNFKLKNNGKYIVKFDYIRRYIYIDVQINNNTKKFRFILDTGSNLSLIKENVIKQIKSIEKPINHIGTRIGSGIGPFYLIDKITLGEKYYEKVVLGKSTDIPFNADGLLGSDIFKQDVIEIDYEHKVLKIWGNEYKQSELNGDKNIMKLKFIENKLVTTKVPIIQCKVNNHIKNEFLLDTGYPGGICLFFDPLVKNKIERKSIFERSRGLNYPVFINSDSRNHKILDSFRIDGTLYNNVIAEINKNAVCLLGNSFLMNYKVIIDYKCNLIVLISNNNNLKYNKSWAFYNKGRLYMAKGKPFLALAKFTEAVTLAPEWLELYIYRGRMYLSINKFSEAEKDFTKIIESNCTDHAVLGTALYLRGTTYIIEGMFKSAISEFSKALNYHVYIDQCLLNRGICYLKTKKYEKSRSDFIKALELNSNAADAYYGLGRIHSEKREFEKAIKQYAKAIKENKNLINKKALFYMGQAYENIGLIDKAKLAYKQYIQITKEEHFNPNIKNFGEPILDFRKKARDRLNELEK